MPLTCCVMVVYYRGSHFLYLVIPAYTFSIFQKCWFY